MMEINKMVFKVKTGTLLLAILLVCTLFVQAASSKEILTTTDEPSELEQGLIDALNSNTKENSTDDIIADYFKDNEVTTSNLKKNSKLTEKTEYRTYPLKDESYITFTDEDIFFITGSTEDTGSTEEANNDIVVKSGTSSTPTLTGSKAVYATISGAKLYTMYVEGSFTYDGTTVDAHYDNSWYVREPLATVTWNVENWEEGSYEHSSGTQSDIYGRGNFEWGIYIDGYGVTLQEYYNNLYLACDEDGAYWLVWQQT
jgi:hypothetical protein